MRLNASPDTARLLTRPSYLNIKREIDLPSACVTLAFPGTQTNIK